MTYKNLTDQKLIELLQDEAQADAYFYEIIKESKTVDQQQAQKLVVTALKNIAQAQGGLVNNLSQVLPESSTQSLYKILSSVILKVVR